HGVADLVRGSGGGEQVECGRRDAQIGNYFQFVGPLCHLEDAHEVSGAPVGPVELLLEPPEPITVTNFFFDHAEEAADLDRTLGGELADATADIVDGGGTLAQQVLSPGLRGPAGGWRGSRRERRDRLRLFLLALFAVLRELSINGRFNLRAYLLKANVFCFALGFLRQRAHGRGQLRLCLLALLGHCLVTFELYLGQIVDPRLNLNLPPHTFAANRQRPRELPAAHHRP